MKRRATLSIVGALFLFLFALPSARSEDIYTFERMWPVLQQPWYFHQPFGMTISDQGFVYIADQLGDCIRKYTLDGHLVTKWGRTGNGDGEFSYPIGLALDGFGHIYVADRNNHRIQKFDEDGDFITRWGSEGTGNGQFTSVFSIAADKSGNVYAVDKIVGSVQKFTPDGKFLLRWPVSGWSEGIAVAPDGVVHVIGLQNVQRFSPKGIFLDQWGVPGFGDGELGSPVGIVFDRNGHVYITDDQRPTGQVQKFSATGTYITGWGDFDDTVTNFNGAYGIAIDRKGMIYVSEQREDRIQKFTSGGQFVTKWASSDIDAGKFRENFGIAVDQSGDVYVADVNNHRVQKFDGSGQFLREWGEYGSNPGQFKKPKDVAINSDGYVFVTEGGNSRVQKFSPDGQYVDEISLVGLLVNADFISIDHEDNIYVASRSTTPHVKKFNPDGSINENWVVDPNIGGHGITTDSKGFVYVSDYRKITKLTPDGAFVLDWGETGSGDGQLKMPYTTADGLGLAVDSEDNIYIADTYNHRFQKFDTQGNFLSKWGTHGSEPGQVSFPADIAVGPNGRIYVSDQMNHRVQAFTLTQSTSNNKAIIVAGGGPFAGNNLWNATQAIATFAYRTLNYQGFSKDKIWYLSANTDLDLDSNGVADEVDGDATNANLQHAITEWAADADSVLIYLVDHGGDGTFRMSGAEMLAANDLKAWLDTLQDPEPTGRGPMNGRVTVIYDACESGTFLTALAPTSGENRIIITSTSPGESAYFISQGSISFSNYFWSHIFNGLDIKNAYDLAAQAMGAPTELQHPLLDADGDGVGNQPADYALCENVFIGNGTASFGDGPVIGSVSDHQLISGTASATIDAFNVSDADSIGRVWAVLRPPDYNQSDSGNPVSELPSVDLLPIDGEPGSYRATYELFTKAGTWQIAVYARDRIGNTSRPSLTSITVDSPLRRKAVVVAAGATGDSFWPVVEASAKKALEALLAQGYGSEDVYLLSPASIAGVSLLPVLPSQANLGYAVTDWAALDSLDVIIYLVGQSSPNGIQLSAAESLTPATLDGWLDTLQESLSGIATVVIDSSQSGQFMAGLAPPIHKQRIVITSAEENQPACFLNQGQISFSQYFWSQVANGASVFNAFILGRNAIEYQTWTGGAIIAQIDDSGNGSGNEKTDGLLARNHVIGIGVTLAWDDPLINAISPQVTIEEGEAATIWTGDITTTGIIERVWATVTSPDHIVSSSQDPVTDLPTITLVNMGNGTYQSTYNDFTTFGTYKVSAYAIDTDGNMSPPRETSFCYGVCSDLYENDDTFSGASILPIRTHQDHNFHNSGDEDWIKFYGIAGVTYLLRANFLGDYCDPVIELYDSDGLTLLGEQNTEGDPHAIEYLYWQCKSDGVYYARIRNYQFETYGAYTDYQLDLWISMVSSHGTIEGTVTDAISGKPISNALIKSWFQDASAISDRVTGAFQMAHPDGNATLIVNAEGYKPTVVTLSVPIADSVTEDITLLTNTAYKDNYEDDDASIQATVIAVDDSPQRHTFHNQGDVDWLKFHGLGGKPYEINAENLEHNCDVKMELYDEDGTVVIPNPIDASGPGGEESFNWVCPNDGVYYLKLQQKNPADYGDYTGHEIAIQSGVNHTAMIHGDTRYELTQLLIPGVVIILRDSVTNDAACSTISDATGGYRMFCGDGAYSVSALIYGDEKPIGDVVMTAGNKSQWDVSLAPIVGDINGDKNIDLSDAITCLKTLAGGGSNTSLYRSAGVNPDTKLAIEDALYIFQCIANARTPN